MERHLATVVRDEDARLAQLEDSVAGPAWGDAHPSAHGRAAADCSSCCCSARSLLTGANVDNVRERQLRRARARGGADAELHVGARARHPVDDPVLADEERARVGAAVLEAHPVADDGAPLVRDHGAREPELDVELVARDALPVRRGRVCRRGGINCR